MEKDEVAFFYISKLSSNFVPIITVFQNITLKEKYLG